MNKRGKKRANQKLVAVLAVSGLMHVAVFLVLGSIVIFTAIPQSKPEFEEAIVPQPINLQELDMKQDMSKMVRTGGSTAQSVPLPRNLITVDNALSATIPSLSLSVSPTAMSMAAPSLFNGTSTLKGTGIGSGTGDGLGGLGKSGSIGMGEYSVSFLGVQSGGERVAILVDCSDFMLEDEKGGMWAFRIVKDECVRMVQNLLPGVLFNVYLFSSNNVYKFKEHMVASTPSVVGELREWIAPINEDERRRGTQGINNFAPEREFFNQRSTMSWEYRGLERRHSITVANYARALHAAMEDHAEAIFMIIATFPTIHQVLEDMSPRDAQRVLEDQRRADIDFERRTNQWRRHERRWEEYVKKREEADAPVWKRAQEIWDAENARRKAAGLPPRIVVGHHLRKVMEENNMKFPVEPRRPENLPPRPIRPHLTTPAYTLDKLIERFTREIIPEMYRFHPKKMRPSINVILFGSEGKAEENWKKFVLDVNRGTRGQFRKITSLKEMQDAAAESEQHREKK